jgi:hypothetical protein
MSFDNFHNENQRTLNNTLLGVLDRYQSNFIEYHENVTDFNRNISRIINMIAHNHSLPISSTNVNQQIPTRRSRPVEYDIITQLFATSMNPSINPQTSPVISRGLTAEEVTNNTRTIQYSSEMNEPRCPISHVDFEEGEDICQIIPCSHYFKTNAIMRWLNSHSDCPVCRRDLRENNDNPILNPNPYIQPNQNVLNNFSRIVSNAIQNELDGSSNSISYTFDIPFNYTRH